MADVDHVFVYGTLRRGFSNPGRDILTTHGRHIDQARLPGVLYDLGSFPALVTAPSCQRSVQGEVYELAYEPQIALERLDRYEGAAGATPGPYKRKALEAELEDGSILTAWAYVWTEPVDDLEPVPSGDYVAHLGER